MSINSSRSITTLSLLALTICAVIYGMEDKEVIKPQRFVFGQRFVPQKIYGSPLHKAVSENDISEFHKLIATDMDFNVKDHFGRTPLELAVSYANVSMCQALLTCRSVDICPILAKAFTSESAEIREFFAQKYVDENVKKMDRHQLNNPLVQAISSGDQERLDQCLPQFRDESSIYFGIDTSDGIQQSFASVDDIEALKLDNELLLQNKQKEFGECFPAAVFAAVNARNFSALKRLIEYKAV